MQDAKERACNESFIICLDRFDFWEGPVEIKQSISMATIWAEARFFKALFLGYLGDGKARLFSVDPKNVQKFANMNEKRFPDRTRRW